MRVVLFLFGFLLPSFTITFELTTHACRDALFDPLPTILDLVLCVSLPLASTALAAGYSSGLLSGFALGISGVYALVLLPVVPVAVIAIVYLGVGLLPLSPLLGFLTLAACSHGQRGRGKGMLLAVLALLMVHNPSDRVLVELARSSHAWLRELGESGLRGHDLRPLVAAGAGDPQRSGVDPVSVLLSWLGPLPMPEARDIYYGITGQPFSEVDAFGSVWRADPDLAGDGVGARRPGLRLAREEWRHGWWDLTFSDAEGGAEEARAIIHLPPGGVVSGATLWMNDRPVAARFTSPVRAESAYASTVTATRDPLVISSAGPDRVLVKAYPVRRELRLRLRIEGRGQPFFEETNFAHPCLPWAGLPTQRYGPPLRDEIVVVDGSAALEPHRPVLGRLLKGRRVVVAGGTSLDRPFRGGHDNTATLAWACSQKPGAVLWIHGSQPLSRSTEGVKGPRLLSLAVTPGPNRVLEKVPFEEVPRSGKLREDLRALLAQSRWKVDRHPGLARVEALLAAGDPAAARREACRRGLVTRVSSALVLESEAGNPFLPRSTAPTAVGPGFSYPGSTVPEPSALVLAALALPLLRRRR